METSKKMMLLKAVAISFIFVELQSALSYPQNCPKCARGAPHVPLFMPVDNTPYYRQSKNHVHQSARQSSRNPFLPFQSVRDFFQELSGRSSSHQGLHSNPSHSRRIREVKSDIAPLPHDVNLQDDSVISVRVIRQTENNVKQSEVQQNSTVQDVKGQESKNTEKNVKVKRPLVPSPRAKLSREQKLLAESLFENPIPVPSAKVDGSSLELGEIIPEEPTAASPIASATSSTSTTSVEKISQLQSFPQMSGQYNAFIDPVDKPIFYYPVRRYAEYYQSPQSRVVIVPHGARIMQAPQVNYDDLISLPIFYDDYGMDYENPGVADQIEKPETEKKTQDADQKSQQNEEKISVQNVNERRNVSAEVKAKDLASTTPKP